jgi:hypothetical protein
MFFMSFYAIFTMLFLRKSFWMITINTFFIFHTPFSSNLLSSFTSCHYGIMTENKLLINCIVFTFQMTIENLKFYFHLDNQLDYIKI